MINNYVESPCILGAMREIILAKWNRILPKMELNYNQLIHNEINEFPK